MDIEKQLEEHRKMILRTLEKELKGGPVVVRGRDIPRFEVSRLDGDVLVGKTARGANLRIPYDSSIGLTGARRLSDPDSRDWWILFGPSIFADPTKPSIESLSMDFEPNLDRQVRSSLRKQEAARRGGVPHE